MIDILNTQLQFVSAHHTGNKTNEEKLITSKSPLDIANNQLRELLLKFFLHSFTQPEFFSFTSANDEVATNPVYNFVSKIFENTKTFHKTSVDIAKHLYEISNNPIIKSGNLFVAYFPKINAEDEITDAIGIFKSESQHSFLKLDSSSENFVLHFEAGISIDKLDKGCIIFNSSAKQDYKICVVDKATKAGEANYWKDIFLQLKPCQDDYHYTKEFMNITRNYVTQQMKDEFDVSKTDQIDLLNRSVEYFKSHDSFDKEDFQNEVFQDKNIIKSFRNFDESYREENNLDIEDYFDISTPAVKKQAKIFKSILKLDKNFHIYIHGNRNLIEKGTDDEGRKFYKIYYENES